MPDPNDRIGSAFPARLVMAAACLNLFVLVTELTLNIGKALIPG